MSARFEFEGVRFQFPENWTLERADAEDGWTVSVQSPQTAFMMVTLRSDMPSVNSVLETALDAMRQDYPDLEADECVESLAGQPAVGHDIRFFSMDFTNTCWTRCLYSSRGTILVLCQTNDLESDLHEPVLKAMCASLEIDDD